MTRLVLFLAFVTGGLLASPALASKVTDAPGEMRVTDEAGLFSADAIAKAKETFHDTIFHGPVKFAVQTYKRIPDAKRADFAALDKKDKDALKQFFQNWAEEQAAREGKGYIFVLLYKTESGWASRCVADRQTDVGRGFGNAKADEVSHRFYTALEQAVHEKLHDAALHAKLDTALVDATHLVISDMKNTTLPATNHQVNAAHGGGEGRGIMGWVCIGLCVMAGIWLVMGLIRAFTGGGGGGGGMGGGGYGGGGGGFGSSLLGGLFGSMAGMYMYNQFFGGGMSNLGASDSTAADGGNYDTGDGDYSGGAGAGDVGGDFGDSGGGDTGGGGDWGGDAGGGDFGGGDFGGGDW